MEEHYGPARLDWGTYPLGIEHDMGGCAGERHAFDEVDAGDARRLAHSKKTMEERGGNNPYAFESCPERLRYAIGTGCMNPACHCYNCHGDCKCGANGAIVEGFAVAGRDWKFWAVALLVAWIVYKYMGGKKLF